MMLDQLNVKRLKWPFELTEMIVKKKKNADAKSPVKTRGALSKVGVLSQQQ